jgi:hypothetical protein
MSVTINGTNGLVFNDNSSQASAQVGMKNRLIDAGFIINQRVYVSGTSLSSGVYAHDRWKAGSSGCTYTFTQGSVGVPITITITAGSLQQVIEGCNMPEGGTYTLSWSGTAQARINGGSYAASPITVTGLTAGANCTVEFGTGTLTKPQFEVGSTATSFDYRPYGTELALCQRYAQPCGQGGTGRASSSTGLETTTQFRVPMRATPVITFGGFSGAQTEISQFGVGSVTVSAVSNSGFASATGSYLSYTTTGATTGSFCACIKGDTSFANAEL